MVNKGKPHHSFVYTLYNIIPEIISKTTGNLIQASGGSKGAVTRTLPKYIRDDTKREVFI
jgi:hypothetical protein